MLKKQQSTSDVDASRILVKGPEFLRKQMEREGDASKGRVSAVERLAATKPQYVRSQQTVEITRTISVESPSVSSQSSSNEHGSVKNADVEDKPSPEEDNNVVRRSSSKKRPDSILLYRQKCDLLRGSPGRSRRLLKKSVFVFKDKTNALSEARGGESEAEVKNRALSATRKSVKPLPVSNGQPDETGDVPTAPVHRRVAETRDQERKSRRSVSRSSSDISSRYSKNFADFDAFFKYCGLDGDVITSLGKENFSARSDDLSVRIRSVSTSTSDGGLSRSSDGLQEEELRESVRQGASVIERNARIIKWLYSCRNAEESGKTLRDLH